MSNVKMAIALAVAMSYIVGPTGIARAASDGCTAAAGLSCSYVARQAGGIAATGNGWTVTVVRGDQERTYGPSDMTDIRGSTLKRPNAIRAGDSVLVRTTRPADVCLCVSGTFGAVTVGSEANR